MPDFYFRGTLAQYWKAIYAEYQRLFLLYGREPFEFTSPNPKTSPLAEYAPNYSDFVEILFWEAEHRDFIVRVKADTVLDAELVNLYVDIYVEPLKKSGESAYASWLEIQTAWLVKGWLINPAVYIAEIGQLEIRPEQLPKPKTGADLTVYFDRHHQKKKTGQKYTLKQVAEETGFEYIYVRQLHSKYLKERGLAKPEKRTNKKTNKN